MKSYSSTKTGTGVTVHASPLNHVKVEMVLLMAMALVLWLVLQVALNWVMPFWFWFVVGLLSALWVVLRTRHILKRHLMVNTTQSGR